MRKRIGGEKGARIKGAKEMSNGTEWNKTPREGSCRKENRLKIREGE